MLGLMQSCSLGGLTGGQARIKDRGWRIDYLLGNKIAFDRLVSVEIDRQGGLEVSDHAPVILDLHSS